MEFIPPFHPHSEALMSNLASRSHEWTFWQITEQHFEVPQSARSKGKRKAHFRILLEVQWVGAVPGFYVLHSKSSPTDVLLKRVASSKDVLKSVRILSSQSKNSRGAFEATDKLT